MLVRECESTGKCESKQILEYGSIQMWKQANVEVGKCGSSQMQKYAEVKIRMFEPLNKPYRHQMHSGDLLA